MREEQIAKALKDAGIENEITCPQAFGIAAKTKISKKEIGDYCTANKIKIRGCQLGCFR